MVVGGVVTGGAVVVVVTVVVVVVFAGGVVNVGAGVVRGASDWPTSVDSDESPIGVETTVLAA